MGFERLRDISRKGETTPTTEAEFDPNLRPYPRSPPSRASLHPPSVSSQQGQTNLDDMNELEVIRKDAIRLAAVVVNLSKKYKPFQERVRVLGHRALNTRQLSDLEHVCEDLRTVYASLLGLEGKALAQEMADDPDLGLDPPVSP
jgi:hypothetical protein